MADRNPSPKTDAEGWTSVSPGENPSASDLDDCKKEDCEDQRTELGAINKNPVGHGGAVSKKPVDQGEAGSSSRRHDIRAKTKIAGKGKGSMTKSSRKDQGKNARSVKAQRSSKTEGKTDDDREQLMPLYDVSRHGTVIQNIYNVRNVDQINVGPTTIQDAIPFSEMECLRHFRDDFNELFVPTAAFNDSADLLGEHHALVVTGAPGSGKTFISQQLLLKLCDEQQCNPFQPTVPKEYLKWCNVRERQAFLMDDVFGASNISQAKYDAWINVFPNMLQHLRSLNTFLIFICRYNILKPHLHSLRKFEFFKNIINLSDEKYQLTEKNKIDMFDNHTSKFKINVTVDDVNLTRQTKWVDGNSISLPDPIGFPQCVRIFCSMPKVSRADRLKYFHCPMDFLSDVVGSFREDPQDRLPYCVLILLLIKDGRLLVNMLHPNNEPTDEMKWCMRMCQVDESKTTSLRDAADNLCGTLLQLDKDSFVYQHPSIMEAVTYDFGKRYPSDILERCSVTFLVERVFTQVSLPTDNDFVVIMQPTMFEQLCTRLVKEITHCVSDKNTNELIERQSLRSLSAYRGFTDGAFTKEFLHHLHVSDTFSLLFTSVAPDSECPTSESSAGLNSTFVFLAAASDQEALIHEVISVYWLDVQRIPQFMDHLDWILYAACNSGSPAAVDALLAAGARADFKIALRPIDTKCDWLSNYQTCTTLMHAAYSGNIEVLDLICDHLQKQGVNVAEHLGIGDTVGLTALHWWAVVERGAAALHILLARGADINAQDASGNATLHNTVLGNDAAASKLLMESGADINMRDKQGYTVLMHCAYRGYEAITRLLLNARADVNVATNDGETALHRSAMSGKETGLRLLLDAGADVNVRKNSGQTALHLAAERGHDALVRKLVEAESDVHIIASSDLYNVDFVASTTSAVNMTHSSQSWNKRYDNLSAMEVALLNGHSDVAKFLVSLMLSHPADTLSRCSDAFLLTHVHIQGSCQHGNIYAVIIHPEMFTQLCERLALYVKHWSQPGKISADVSRRLFSKDSIFNDTTSMRVFLQHLRQTDALHLLFTSASCESHHPTLMFLAAALSQNVIVRETLTTFLQDVRQLPHFRDHLNRILYASCYSESPEITKVLIAAGARADYTMAHDPDDMVLGRWGGATKSTTLMHAAFSSNVEVLRIVCDRLQQKSVVVSEHLAIRERGRTALRWWALGRQKADALQFIMDLGIDLNGRDALSYAILVWAHKFGDSVTSQVILEHEPDMDSRVKRGQTFLMESIECDDVAAILLLLQSGVCVNDRDDRGQTALLKSVERGHGFIISMLLNEGADINAGDEHGKTALMKSVERGDENIVRLLLGAGPDINAKDEHGQTALMKSVERGDEAIIRRLLRANPDMNAKDEHRNTAMMKSRRSKAIITLLVGHIRELDKATIQKKELIALSETGGVQSRLLFSIPIRNPMHIPR